MRRASGETYPSAGQQILWGAGVVIVFFAAIGLFVLWTWLSGPYGKTNEYGNGIAAQSNLQNALTGARTYETSAGTFSGLMTGSIGISSISQTGTGLDWTTGASTGPHEISNRVGGGGTYLVLSSFSYATNRCWGILYIANRQPSPVFGQTAPGTYFFLARSSINYPAGLPGCVAATVRPTAVSTGGFPDS